MQIPIQITFRNFSHSDAVEADVRQRVAHLERISRNIIACRVIVESAFRKHVQGNLFHIRVDLRIPGKEIVVTRAPAMKGEYENIYVALRDTFDAATRKLQEYIRRRRARRSQKRALLRETSFDNLETYDDTDSSIPVTRAA